ncbi:hypothetical protein SAMN06269185_1390 [Natronoarchaeum philippinense]|uniref:Uncharacterized protein n=1 Tax=Natronoarchaeum philippinense TaxID=558529 RepID=A0A285NQH8_NATPI|nr:hypothetical protein [Natronoarchaeum philippinense]SNZ11764.1 hypothetical protein SAMN06269185_1390 [Natronoarchaeum philippinense]
MQGLHNFPRGKIITTGGLADDDERKEDGDRNEAGPASTNYRYTRSLLSGADWTMTCTNCGSTPLSMRYTLRFTPDGRPSRNIDLYLCDACLSGLCSDPDIELVDEPAAIRLRE